MKKFEKLKQFVTASRANTVAFAVTAALTLSATIGAASATVVYLVDDYESRVQIYDIGVTLVENGENSSWRNYHSAWIGPDGSGNWDEHLGELLKDTAQGEPFVLRKPYTEELYVRNSGTVNEYVRVSIYCYWCDAETEEKVLISPENIDLHIINLNKGWLLDEASSTVERTVLYYNRLIKPGEETLLFADEFKITDADASYDGVKFMVEVRVDAIQENSANDAAKSAWGTNVVIDEEAGTLTLGN